MITYGNAINFVSASSQYARRTRVSTAVNNITVALWLYINIMPGTSYRIFANGGSSNNAGYSFSFDSAGKITCDMRFVDASCKTSTALTTATWYHIIFERSAGTSTFYINAVADGATSGSQWNALQGNSATTVGAYADSDSATPSGYSDVRIDDLRYYDRAITSGERTSLYNYGLNINNADIASTNLVAWWKMNESSGNPADSSGNSNTLTNGNTATFVTGIVQLTNTNPNFLAFM